MTFLDHWRHGRIRRHDDDGRLAEAGYRWDQLRLIEKLGLAALSAAAIILAPFMYVGHSPQASVAFAMAGLGLLAIFVVLQKWPRTVVFTREASVLTPHGLPGRLFLRRLDFPHTEISSIEATRNCRDYGVVIFTTEGRTILLAERMFKADARLAAVQLTKALREMRESIATIAGKREQASGSVLIN